MWLLGWTKGWQWLGFLSRNVHVSLRDQAMTGTGESTDFWHWALAAYSRKGVADACLELQDEYGQCVPLLLWAQWCAVRGVGLGEADAIRASSLARPWVIDVISPLRGIRRRLKTEVSTDDTAARLALRERVKVAELEAERALMEQLQALPVAGGPGDDNLRAAAAAWSQELPPSQALVRLSQALTKGQNLEYSGD